MRMPFGASRRWGAKRRFGIKIRDFGTNVDAIAVKARQNDAPHARSALGGTLPQRLDPVAKRADRTHAGDDDAVQPLAAAFSAASRAICSATTLIRSCRLRTSCNSFDIGT